MAKLTDETRASLRRRSRLVNLGRDVEYSQGVVSVPPFRGSTVLSPDVATLKSRAQRFTYGTRGTPTTEALSSAWSELAGAAGTVLAPSGLAAIIVALMTALPGGHFNMGDGGVSEQHLLNALVQGPHFRGIRLSSVVFAWADKTGFWQWSFNSMVSGKRRRLHEVRGGSRNVEVAAVNLLRMPKAWEAILRSYFPGNPMELTQ